jgi:hypothetical protein
MNEHLCLRCRTVVLLPLPSPPGIAFYECPACQRHYALKPGKQLTFRWLNPISVALYGVIFESKPAERAKFVAELIFEQNSIAYLKAMVAEIRLELEDPTQQVRDIVGCHASDEQLREFLSLFTNEIEQLIDGKK